MNYRTHRLILLACLAGAIMLLLRPQASLAADDNWTPANQVDSLAGAAVLLALIAALLMWRYRHVRLQLVCTRRQLARERTLRSRAEQNSLAKHASLCRQATLQESLKENERQRIARDIHDDLGQHLLSLKIDISMLQSGAASLPPQASQKLGLIARNLDRTIQSLRCVINDLRPAALEGGLRAGIEWQLGEFSRTSGIVCELDAGPELWQAGAGHYLDIVVFRILQESLSNITRHARATRVRVTLARHGGGLSMKISDNGVGIAAGSDSGRRGCGLLGMEQRVTAAGGWFFVDSAPGQGTTLSLSLPLREAQALEV